MLSLETSGRTIYRDSEASVNLKKSIIKLENNLPAHYLPDLKIAKERFYFDPNIWWKEYQPLKNLDLLRKAVWHSLKLNILYTKASKNLKETDTRKVRPFELVVKNMDWYLVAYCETREDLSVIGCDRIIKVERLYY